MSAIPNKGRRIRSFPIAAAQTYPLGAPVLLNAAGAIVEAGADPAVILGFALEPAVAANLAPSAERLVSVAYPDSTWWIEGTTNPVAADIGDQYDVGVDGDGVARLDHTSQAAIRLTIEDIDTTRNLYEVSIIGVNRQFQTTT